MCPDSLRRGERHGQSWNTTSRATRSHGRTARDRMRPQRAASGHRTSPDDVLGVEGCHGGRGDGRCPCHSMLARARPDGRCVHRGRTSRTRRSHCSLRTSPAPGPAPEAWSCCAVRPAPAGPPPWRRPGPVPPPTVCASCTSAARPVTPARPSPWHGGCSIYLRLRPGAAGSASGTRNCGVRCARPPGGRRCWWPWTTSTGPTRPPTAGWWSWPGTWTDCPRPCCSSSPNAPNTTWTRPGRASRTPCRRRWCTPAPCRRSPRRRRPH